MNKKENQILPSNDYPSLGKDCEGQDIIPIPGKKLEVKTNRHPTTDGYSWGWIEGTTLNTVWSNDRGFNGRAASDLVHKYNTIKGL